MFNDPSWKVRTNPEFDAPTKPSVVYSDCPEYPPSIFEKGETSNSTRIEPPSKLETNKACRLWVIDFGYSRHMTGFKPLLHNYVEEPAGAVRFANSEAEGYVRGYGMLDNGVVKIQRVLYNFRSIAKLQRQILVKGLPEMSFEKDSLCSACELGKMKRISFKSKSESSTSSTLELLHMDLCSPMRTASINGMKYVLVMIDDYSRYTWLEFLRNKSDAPELIIAFIKRIQVRLQLPVRTIHSDNGTEFKNDTLKSYLTSVGISHNFSAAYTPQQNDIVERKNRTLVEAARTMLAYSDLPMCYILNERQGLSKFNRKADEGYLVGYSLTSKAYRIYIIRTKTVVESMNVSFDESSTRTSGHNISKIVIKDKASIQTRIEPASQGSTSSNSNSTSSELDLLFIDAFDDMCADFDKGISTSITSSKVPTTSEDMSGPSEEEFTETSSPSGITQPLVFDSANDESVSTDGSSGKEVTSTSTASPEASVSETPVPDVPSTSMDLPAVHDENDASNTQQTVESLPNTDR
ncbi:hypothetical protein L6452_02024 [Arctium lappa]|uniref:Uncharacterized protein n=1 Tax=Arctium lappa TaxID=4217 RepID=A0ACB9FJJ9_ARCLA|nr:hypothetical protein L6452_02024 [Arctium lappa]